MNDTPRTINKLKQGDLLRRAAWVAGNRERLLREKPRYGEAAAQAAKDLSLKEIAASTFKVSLEFHNLKWTPLRPEAADKTSRLAAAEKEIVGLKEYCALLDADLAKCRRLIHHLYAELSCKPPAGMHLPSEADRLVMANGRPSGTA